MNEFAMLEGAQDQGTRVLFLLVLMIAAGVGVWRLLQWVREGTVRPDPWDEQTQAGMEGEAARPLCHRCLEPHDPSTYFCPNCGAPVGAYTNWLPFPYVFSLGHLLRIGTDGEFKRTRLNLWGFLLLSAGEYMVFAPIYWFLFFRHWRHPSQGTPPPATPDSAGPTA